jgi:phage terminase large subunit-like protein
MTAKRKLHRTHQYARDVLAGKIVVGELVRLACERHERDIREASVKGFTFDPDAADHAIGFIERWVKLPDTSDESGDALPFILQPWQAFIIGSLFGWRFTSGFRRYRNGYMEIGKGNGKTPLLAAVGLYGLTMDGQKAPEVYAAAADRDQAMIMYRDAVRMVDASPELSKRIQKSGIMNVHNMAYGLGFFRPFSREQGSKSGTRPHMGLIDEIHEAPDAEVINKIRAGAKGNQDAMFLEITNSGSDRTSVCYQHHEHSRRILEQTVEDERWFAYVCTLDANDSPLEDESCWPKVNPNLGVSIHKEYLRDQVSAAKNIPAETNTVLRLNFCIWTHAHTRFLDVPKWHACHGVVLASELIGAKCYAGLDLGQSDDFSAFIRAWLLPDGRVWVVPHFWIPSGALERFKNRPYDEWRRAGALDVIPDSEVIDYELVQAETLALCHASNVREVAYDKRFAEQMAQNLTGAGVTMVNTPQGFQLTEALRKHADLVSTQTLVHDGNPVMGWMAANYVVRLGRNGEMRPDKDKAAEKIDGQVALTMALNGIVRQPKVPEPDYNIMVFGGQR